jgi:hypothetical protein
VDGGAGNPTGGTGGEGGGGGADMACGGAGGLGKIGIPAGSGCLKGCGSTGCGRGCTEMPAGSSTASAWPMGCDESAMGRRPVSSGAKTRRRGGALLPSGCAGIGANPLEVRCIGGLPSLAGAGLNAGFGSSGLENRLESSAGAGFEIGCTGAGLNAGFGSSGLDNRLESSAGAGV